ncbi:hypothetical protein ACTSKR_00105 [Chitinibacteraceae bacterium HSL-7]
MKSRPLLVALCAGVLLAGCASESANVYSRQQVQRLATVEGGVVEQVRAVKIRDATGVGAAAGGVIGGIAAGRHIGGGSGQVVSGIIGAIIGGMLGNAIEQNVTEKDAYEITVRMDNGQRVVIVQGADQTISPQQRVQVINDGLMTRVVPAGPTTGKQQPSSIVY